VAFTGPKCQCICKIPVLFIFSENPLKLGNCRNSYPSPSSSNESAEFSPPPAHAGTAQHVLSLLPSPLKNGGAHQDQQPPICGPQMRASTPPNPSRSSSSPARPRLPPSTVLDNRGPPLCHLARLTSAGAAAWRPSRYRVSRPRVPPTATRAPLAASSYGHRPRVPCRSGPQT
jgi:hypothetical protein